MAETPGDDTPLAHDKTAVLWLAMHVAVVDRAPVGVGDEGKYPFVVGRDDVPCEVAAGSCVDVGHIVSARLQVVAFAGDHLGAIVDVIKNSLLHEQLGRCRRRLGAVNYLVAGAEAHGLTVGQDVDEHVFFQLPALNSVLVLVHQMHPAARRLDDQGVAVVGLIEVALPIQHSVDLVRMFLSRFIPPIQVHRNILGCLTRQKHERPIVIVYVSGKLG